MENSRLVYSTDGTGPPRDLRPAGRNRPKGKPKRQGTGPDDGVARISREKAGRRGKEVTIIRGLPGGEAALRDLAAELKRACGAGGSMKDRVIEIQGDHRETVLSLLRKRGLQAKLAGG